jgi:hypothetical protein
MKISIPQELLAGEKRVAPMPATVEQLLKWALRPSSLAAQGQRKMLRMAHGRPQVQRGILGMRSGRAILF